MRNYMEKKIVSWIIALLSILSVCRSPISGLDLGTLLIITVAIIILIHKKRLYTKRGYIINYFLLYLTLTTIINVLAADTVINNYANSTLVYLRLGKILLILVFFFTLNIIDDVDFDTLMNAIYIIVGLNVAFIVAQRFSYQVLGRTLVNPISYFATNEAYGDASYTMRIGTYIRPSGLFLEPSHFAQYCSLYLCYLLFGKEKMDLKKIAFVAVGIVFSGSGMGVLMLFGLLGTSLIIRFRKNVVSTVVYSILLFAVLVYLSRSPFVQTILDRVFSDGSAYGGNAIESRIGIGYQIYGSLKPISKLFGLGYGHVPNNVYLNGWAYVLNTIGLIGLIMYLGVCIYVFIKTSSWARWSILCYLVLMFGAQMFTAGSIIYFLGIPLVYAAKCREVFEDDAYHEDSSVVV